MPVIDEGNGTAPTGSNPPSTSTPGPGSIDYPGGPTIDDIQMRADPFGGAGGSGQPFQDLRTRIKRNPVYFLKEEIGGQYNTVLDSGIALTTDISQIIKNELMTRSLGAIVGTFSMLKEIKDFSFWGFLGGMIGLDSGTGGIGDGATADGLTFGVSQLFPNGAYLPVAGKITLYDSWHAPRSGGRKHQGIDIMAPFGRPIVAMSAGKVEKLGNGGLGGITIWLKMPNGVSMYHAHCQSIAAGMYVGATVKAGQTIAYVGDTGNARGGDPHLHFQIHPNGRGGAAVNPYPILKYIKDHPVTANNPGSVDSYT